jgi:hypothetical protein
MKIIMQMMLNGIEITGLHWLIGKFKDFSDSL